eukprot:TRINITY_DN38289_c0_g1_i1.p1 TRINITY_DN38289_c0_g1~~TRINITY_DN38289_c0_g1_i1.p1  ORF type:complete len:421 (+),score=63.86 TRINITY_DN38289_c0_g1_i1:113-1375(+)
MTQWLVLAITTLTVCVFAGSMGTAEALTKEVFKCPTVTEPARSSSTSSTSIGCRFRNVSPYPIDLYWISFDGKESQHEEIAPGSTVDRQSFPGHIFRSRQVDSGIMVSEYTVAKTPLTQSVEIYPCLEANEHGGSDYVFKPADVEITKTLIHDQGAACEPAGKSSQWSCVRTLPAGQQHLPKEKYGFNQAELKDSECKRARKEFDTTDDSYSNINHRNKIKRVTKGPGYLKMSMKPELFAMLTEWAGNHSEYWKGENPYTRHGFNNAEAIGGCYANTHLFPFAILNMDHFSHIRDAVVKQLRDALEWWTDQPLEHTSTYGMRIYRRDAMLIDHVDREDTHIASAVIQVFQDCDEDGGWPLEVVGEDGLVREVYLQPGEMVLYEGARLLHGRPMRFKGNHFGNIFSHFKPRKYVGSGHDDL